MATSSNPLGPGSRYGLGRTVPSNHQNPLSHSNNPSAPTFSTPAFPSGPKNTQRQQQQQQQQDAEASRKARDDRERLDTASLAELSEEQREEISEAFNLFDLDKDGLIDYHELKVAMKALGFDLPKQEILQLLNTHGISAPGAPKGRTAAANTNSSSQQQQQQQYGAAVPSSSSGRQLMSFQAFQTLMAQRILSRNPEEEIIRAFELFDEGGKGRITLQDLTRVARELGEGLSHDELVAMIEEFDMDGDNAISREEFINICLG